MRKFIKIISIFLTMCSILCVLSACNSNALKTSLSYTYTVETGDNVKIKLDTSDGYSIEKDLPFKIIKNDTVISEGTFITIDGYNQYKNIVESGSDKSVTIIESETNSNGITYIFYKVDSSAGIEYDYIVKINNSNTGLVIGSLISEADAKDVFNHLTISISD